MGKPHGLVEAVRRGKPGPRLAAAPAAVL